jgi:hypothetical protein
MPVYTPEEGVSLEPTLRAPLFFLAGPILGGDDWEFRMANRILKQEPQALIVHASRWSGTKRSMRYYHPAFPELDKQQLVWKRHYFRKAGLEPNVCGCVIFWLPLESMTNDPHPGPEPYATNTQRDLGKFIAFAETTRNMRVVIGGNPRFYGLEAILFELSNATGEEFPFHETKKETIDRAIVIARQDIESQTDWDHI